VFLQNRLHELSSIHYLPSAQIIWITGMQLSKGLFVYIAYGRSGRELTHPSESIFNNGHECGVSVSNNNGFVSRDDQLTEEEGGTAKS